MLHLTHTPGKYLEIWGTLPELQYILYDAGFRVIRTIAPHAPVDNQVRDGFKLTASPAPSLHDRLPKTELVDQSDVDTRNLGCAAVICLTPQR